MCLSRTLLVCLLALLSPPIKGAEYRFDHLTADTGLPQNSVYSIAQSSQGYIWMTTLDGLVRYDGVRFTVFNRSNSRGLPSNRLMGVVFDGQDDLWIFSEGGALARFRDGEFRTFTTADGLPGDFVYRIMKGPGGQLVAFTRESIARFDGERFVGMPEYGAPFDVSIYFSPSETMWELRGRMLKRTTKEGNETVVELPVNPRDVIDDVLRYDDVIEMFEDREGRLWIYIHWVGGHYYRVENGVIEKLIGMDATAVTSISQDGKGSVWFATTNRGACRYGDNGFECIATKEGLSSDHARSMLADREGTFWIATHDRGVNRLSNQVITPLSTGQGLRSKNVYSILEDRNGAIWIGSFGSLARYENGSVTNFGEEEGLHYPNVQGLFEDRDGQLWMGAVPGIETFKDGRFTDEFATMFPAEKPGLVSVYDIEQTDDGTMFLATLYGLYINDGHSTRKLTVADGLPLDDVKVILKAKGGGVWLGTYGGLALYRDGRLVSYTEKEGLAGNQIRALYEDETGALWIGTYDSGLSRFKDGKFTNFNKDNGLFSNGVFTILTDDRDNFWMSSNQGIYRVNRKELVEVSEGKRSFVTSTPFGKSDGMLNTEANGGAQPSGLKASDGRLWFPTQDGVAIADPAAVQFNPEPPPVVIEESRIDNQIFKHSQNEIRLEPGQENLEIDYTGLSFIKPEQMRFRYRLEGLDAAWVEAGTRRTAFYPHIAPGNYTFRVIAANSDNVWNETGATIRVMVLPPFYLTWWFILAVLLFFSVATIGLVISRFVQLEKRRAAQQAFSRQLIASQEQERKRIAAELHDSLGQRLVVIKNLALMFLNSKNGNTDDESRIEGISAEASQAIGEVKEISYNLRPYQLDRIGLTKAIEAIVRSAQAASNIEFTANIDDIDNYFPKESEINFYRIVQESVGNLVKHSGASKASVEIDRSGPALELNIRDNGNGFVPGQTESRTGGFGLIGISERVELFNGTLDLRSSPGEGTSVRIRMNSKKFTTVKV